MNIHTLQNCSEKPKCHCALWGIGWMSHLPEKWMGDWFLQQQKAEDWRDVYEHQFLLGLPLCLCAGGKWLDGHSLGDLIQCCAMLFLIQFMPSSFIFWRHSLLLPSFACVDRRISGVRYNIGFHVEDQGALLTWISDSVAQEFLVAWLVIKAHRLQAVGDEQNDSYNVTAGLL